ncbi:MAG: S8 family serine peptidase [Xanthomonadales bacterium]|nr:S8 family serine peptidase [Xanthomonadales bacterium]
MAPSGPRIVRGSAGARIDLGGLQDPTPGFDRFIVKYRGGSAEAASAVTLRSSLSKAATAVPAKAGRAMRLNHLRRLGVGADVVTTDRKLDRVEAESLMRQIGANPNVEYVEVDRIMHPLVTPNDTYYATYQWDLSSATTGINAQPAWDVSTGSGVVVADLDTGIASHSDLNANVLPGYDFISDTTVAGDGNGRDSDPSDPGDYYGSDDSSWHGTHTAGTIAAVANNSKGVAGVAYNAKLVPVRVLGRGGGYTSDIADAIIWASGGTVSGVPANANPAEVINMSLGGSGTCDTTTQNAINGAVSRGTTVVVAAGNSNANASGFSPASCNNVITVGATNKSGARASYSNYGTVVDVAAPGGDSGADCSAYIVSTGNDGTQGPGNETYLCMAGTSMAAPHVTGVVALMQAAAPSPLTPAQVESIIKSTAHAFVTSPGSKPIGSGILDAAAAVAAAGAGSGNTAPVANFSFTTSGLTATFTDTSTDAQNNIASRSWNFGDGTTSTATNPTKTYAAAGTYTVTETVTDSGGLSSTKTASVTVSSTSCGGTVLCSGVGVALPSVAKNSWSSTYTMPVLAGHTVTFTISGGTGDADLYVRAGAAPTTSSYNCRPYLSGNAETCTFTPTANTTYYVRVRAYAAFSGVTLKGTSN